MAEQLAAGLREDHIMGKELNFEDSVRNSFTIPGYKLGTLTAGHAELEKKVTNLEIKVNSYTITYN